MTFQTAYDITAADDEPTFEAAAETPIIDKIRRGRLTALAAHRAKFAGSENVVSIFDREMAIRAATPVFCSKRSRQDTAEIAEFAAPTAKPEPYLLTNPIAA